MDCRDFGALVMALAAGVFLGLILGGALNNRERSLWLQEMEQSDRAWEAVAGRAYDQGYADCARAVGREIETTGMR